MNHVDVNFSYDFKYRFHTEESRQRCIETINAFHDRYNYHCGVQMIVTQDVVNMYLNGWRTYHTINEESLDKCKKGVVILNTSRGALVDASALLEGIKSRKVGAACLDVYEEESDIFFEDYSGHIVEDDTLARLITMPNVLVTSHQAFLTEEALSNIAKTTIENIITFFENGECENEICYHCEKTTECKKQRLNKCF